MIYMKKSIENFDFKTVQSISENIANNSVIFT